jgi:zinc protease
MLTMRRTIMVSALLASLAGSGIPGASGAPSAAGGEPVHIEFQKFRLPNGLDVILSEDHRLPLVAVNLWYHVGPANERPGRTGFAHLFEHMMFQGSKHVPHDGHIKLLEGAGATGLNGTTAFDRTNYFETVPSNELELALWLESDRMGFLLDTLDQAKLTNQKDVVRNERRQSIENRPYGLVDEEVFHQLFPQGHPYHADVMGSHADIEAARLDDVRAFFRQYYIPNNASLAIVGDIDPVKVKALVEKYFGPIPAGASVPHVSVTTPPLNGEKRVVVHDKVELPRVYLAWLSAPIFQPGDAEADMLAEILGGGTSSRLYRDLVYDKQIAQDVRADQQSLTLGSVFEIAATARPGVTPEELEKAIEAELAALRQQGPSQAEVERAHNTIEAEIIRGLENLGGFGGVADRLNQYNHHRGDPGYLPQDLARYAQVTPARLKEVAGELFDKNRVVVYGVPGDKVVEDVPKTAATDASEAAKTDHDGKPSQPNWRASPPRPGPMPALALPVPQRFTLANGLTVLLVEQHKLPVVAANLIVPGGSEANPKDRPGLAAFTSALLDQGTEHRSAADIANATAQIGARLTIGSTPDFSFLNVQTLKSNVDTAFDLLSDMALHPAFQREEIERVRSRRLIELQQQRDNPGAIAARVLNQALYGAGHPYGYIELGTRESLTAISRDDVVGFWKSGYAPAGAALVIAGDLTASELKALAEKYFGAWKGEARQTVLPAPPPPGARRIIVVDRGAAPQTALRIGAIGVPRANPDYVPLEVMNTTLGGIFASRINLNLREVHGYTYGASSGFAFRRGPGPFLVVTGVRTDVTAPALHEIFNELDRMRSEPVTDEELRLARDSVARSLPGGFETSAQTTRSIGQIFVYALPLDYYRTLPTTIQAVSVADVHRVARQHLRPDQMIAVAVGDRARIEPALKDLQLGTVEQGSAD